MLRLSKLADYSVVLLTTLAVRPNELVTAAQLSERTKLPVPTVAKLLKKLAKSGHVNALRGAAGGYRLARMPDSISAASVIEAVDGPVRIVSCAGPEALPCEREVSCGIRGRWDPVNAIIRNALHNLTLAEMVGSTCQTPCSETKPVSSCMGCEG
jgi:FeS assembly SUF system regulator